jgi:hypothetical protein
MRKVWGLLRQRQSLVPSWRGWLALALFFMALGTVAGTGPPFKFAIREKRAPTRAVSVCLMTNISEIVIAATH